MGYFNNIDKAKVSLGGAYLKPDATYLCSVAAVKMVRSRRGKDLYTVELEVLKSTHPEVRPGAKATWQANLSDHDAALGNVKLFLAATVPCGFEEADEGVADMSITPENPLRGRLITVRTVNQKTLKGSDFTKHIFEEVAETDQAQGPELRKAAGF